MHVLLAWRSALGGPLSRSRRIPPRLRYTDARVGRSVVVVLSAWSASSAVEIVLDWHALCSRYLMIEKQRPSTLTASDTRAHVVASRHSARALVDAQQPRDKSRDMLLRPMA